MRFCLQNKTKRSYFFFVIFHCTFPLHKSCCIDLSVSSKKWRLVSIFQWVMSDTVSSEAAYTTFIIFCPCCCSTISYYPNSSQKGDLLFVVGCWSHRPSFLRKRKNQLTGSSCCCCYTRCGNLWHIRSLFCENFSHTPIKFLTFILNFVIKN